MLNIPTHRWFYNYRASRNIVAKDYPFHALIMAAMVKADSDNADKLRAEWPELWLELQARDQAPDGCLTDQERAHVEWIRRGH